VSGSVADTLGGTRVVIYSMLVIASCMFLMARANTTGSVAAAFLCDELAANK
jgi:nitrate/nitrite transporter NarK